MSFFIKLNIRLSQNFRKKIAFNCARNEFLPILHCAKYKFASEIAIYVI